MGIDKQRRGYKKGSGRDGGGFVALPWAVLDSLAYRLLSHPAKSLLLEFARQYVRDNNGRLLASGKFLAKRGWKSADVIQRAKRELIDAEFIYETVKGHRPNKASWYAITWQDLDKHLGYDAGTFEGWRDARSGYEKTKGQRIKSLTPSEGITNSAIIPSSVVKTTSSTPSSGTVRATFASLSTPSNGIHLEIPSIKGVSYGNQG
jgi:hypothetical protein